MNDGGLINQCKLAINLWNDVRLLLPKYHFKILIVQYFVLETFFLNDS